LALLSALNRSLRYQVAAIRAAFSRLDLHICYSLSLDDDTSHADLLNVSARCVRRVHPRARITVLTDKQSLATTILHLTNLTNNGVSRSAQSAGSAETPGSEAGSSKPRREA
jgi:hypothetical protein